MRLGPRVAELVLRRLVRAFDRLGAYPHIGHRREDLTSDKSIRFWRVGPTLIAYRRGRTMVDILIVERGDLDWKSVLAEPSE